MRLCTDFADENGRVFPYVRRDINGSDADSVKDDTEENEVSVGRIFVRVEVRVHGGYGGAGASDDFDVGNKDGLFVSAVFHKLERVAMCSLEVICVGCISRMVFFGLFQLLRTCGGESEYVRK